MPSLSHPRSKGARNAAATKQALLRAGTELFSRKGLEGASVDAISRAAGVNKAMVSYHFGGKLGLYTAILEEAFAALEPGVRDLAASSDPAAERLERYIGLFGDLHRARPQLSILLLRELVGGAGDRLAKVLVPRFLLMLALTRGIVEQGVAEGSFRPTDPFLLHQLIVGSVTTFFAIAPFRDRRIAEGAVPVASIPDPREYVRLVQSVIIGGLAPAQER